MCLDFDEVGVLENSLTKRSGVFAGILRWPLRQVDESLTIEHEWGKLVRVSGISLKPHAREREPNGFATNGCLRLVRGHPSSIDTVFAG
jgi:hypothetical protein